MTIEDPQGIAISPSSMVAKAQAIAALIAPRNSEIESTGYLPKDIAELLAEAGLYRMLTPTDFGGGECHVTTFVESIEALARVDASVAWCTFIACTAALISAYLPTSAAKEIYKHETVKISGVFAPSGRAERTIEDGVAGFRVNGSWAWASGAHNADFIAGGCLIIGHDGKPELLPNGKVRVQFLMFPRAKVKLLDNWTAFGLRGTGSVGFEVSNEFVPELFSTCLMMDKPIGRTLYKFPLFGLLSVGIGAVALGMARAALDELKNDVSTGKKLSKPDNSFRNASAHSAIARAEAKISSSRIYLINVIEDAWREARVNEDISLQNRCGIRLATNNAVDDAVAVIQSIYDLGGGEAVFEGSKFQRYLRDINVLKQHKMVRDSIYELAGSALLGEVDIDGL